MPESRRERETFRYDPSLIAQAIHNDLDHLTPAAELRASPDPALTAFAELAVLRLKTSRALISLFDREHQYIVAEATPSLSLTPSAGFGDHAAGEHLVLCGTAIPRGQGICELALGVSPSSLPEGSLDDAHVPVTVIPDLAADPRSSQRQFCHLLPDNRFYTGVPLRTPKGIDIGVFCVLDTQPREDLDNISIRFLQDLSKVVVEYLDQWRQRKSQCYADRMIRGVGTFVEAKSIVSEETAERVDIRGADLPQEGCIDELQQHFQRNLNLQSPHTLTSRPSPWAQLEPDDLQKLPPSQTRPARRPGPSPIFDPTSSETPATPSRSMSYFAHVHPKEPQIQHIFSTAADAIREAIDAEHVLFLQASIGLFGGLAETTPCADKLSADSKSSSSSSDEMENPRTHRVVSSSQGKAKSSCRVLGFSSPAISSIDLDPVPEGFSSVPERFLAKLLRRFPRGKVFNFNAKGKIESGDDDQPHGADSRSTNRISLYEEEGITAIFPGARSVVIVPLWDTQKHRWYAGGFVCSTTPARTFTVEHELSYLRAFGILIMSKIHRFEAQVIGRSINDLLNSLSHELRSPLHGIILGAELLNDTSLDKFQGETLASIETCGRTLLDAMDHLLELSDINNFVDPSSHQQGTQDATAASGTRGPHHRDAEERSESLGIEAGTMRNGSDVEVDVLAEEVVESVCAGFMYQRQAVASLVNEQPTERAEVPDVFRRLDRMQAMEDVASKSWKRASLLTLLGDIAVTFHINPAVSWTFNTQPGAIRRIIMNLVGNSLKFTIKGTVNVKVLQELQEEGKSSPYTTVKIIVTDTGRGMSENYLHNHLFSPFYQEDSLSAGLGLGLCLVARTVAKLGGSMQVLSKLGQGTKVTVVLPLLGAAASPPPTGNPSSASFNEFRSLAGQLDGLRVRLHGLPSEHNEDRDGGSDWLKGVPCEGALLANMCAEWLRMHVVEESIPRQLLADLIITSEASLEGLFAEQRQSGVSAPVVVICRNALIARRLATSAGVKSNETFVEFVSQPIGPRKLAKVLLLSLRRWIKLEASAAPNQTPSLLDPEEATPVGLGSNPGISFNLKQEVEYFCNPLTKSETFTGPAAEVSIAEFSQREETLVQHEENGTQTSDPPAQRKEDPGPILVPAAPTTLVQKPDPSKPRFLLVDDNPINLRILTTFVKKLGHRFTCATNGLEAFEAFQKSCVQDAEDFKFVFMDISMPVMDGLESTRRIRTLEMERGLSRCNIFALTGLASTSVQQEASASGIDLFLTKPVRLKELTKILERKGGL